MTDRRRVLSGLLGAASLVAVALLPSGPRADDHNLSTTGLNAPRPQVETMSAERAYEMAGSGEMVLIDVRPAAAWPVVGLPEHAEALDFSDPMFWDIVDMMTDGDKSKPVGLICWTGGRSLHVAEEMKKRGYRRPIDIGEGIRGSEAGPGWIAKGLPMSEF